jgi:hypothetical protein
MRVFWKNDKKSTFYVKKRERERTFESFYLFSFTVCKVYSLLSWAFGKCAMNIPL